MVPGKMNEVSSKANPSGFSRMRFKHATVSYAVTGPSCNIERLLVYLGRIEPRPVRSAEWHEEQKAKQRVYEEGRLKHYERVGIKRT